MSDTHRAPTSRPMTPPGTPTIRVSPSEFCFQTSKSNPNVYVGRVSLRTVAADSPIGFKFKTNAPDRYSVRPVMGVLSPDGEAVDVYARCDGAVQVDDRFMIESVTLTEEEASQLNPKTWRQIERRRIIENFINCRLYTVPTTMHGTLPSHATTSGSTARRGRGSTPQRHPNAHARDGSMELSVPRQTTTTGSSAASQQGMLTVTSMSATHSPSLRPSSPSVRPLVVGVRPRGSMSSLNLNDDVETGLSKEKRTTPTVPNQTLVHRSSAQPRHHVDKGLIDLLPQIAILLLVCIVLTLCIPVHYWVHTVLLPWLDGSNHVIPPSNSGSDVPLADTHFAPAAPTNPSMVFVQA